MVKERFSGKIVWTFFLCLIAFLGMGFSIFYQETVPRSHFSHQEKMDALIAAEKKYKQYRHIISPQISSVKMNVDLFPKERQLEASGEYILMNRSDKMIDTLVLNYRALMNVEYDFGADFEHIAQENIGNMAHFDVVKLKEGLNPGDSVKMTFSLKSPAQNWFHINGRVKYNGTFINDEICPRFGWWLHYLRDELGMNYDEKTPHPSDTLAIRNSELAKGFLDD